MVSARGFWKLPETYERGREQENALAIVVTVTKIVVLAGLIVFGMWLLIQATRHGAVPWRAVIRLALPATLIFPIAPLLSAGLMMRDYNTAVPLETFQATAYVVIGMSAVLGFVLMGAAAAVLCTFYPDAVRALGADNRRPMGIDAAAALAAAIGMGIVLHQVQGFLTDRFHAQAILSMGSPDIISSSLPAAAALAGAVRSLLTNAALLGLIVLAFQQVTKTWMRIVGVAAALCALLPGEIRTPAEFALQFTIALVMAAAAYGFLRIFARRNYLAWALLLWLMALRGPMLQLLGNGNGALEMQGWIVAAVMAASVVWAVLPSFGKSVPARIDIY